jgi:hypothetical protein
MPTEAGDMKLLGNYRKLIDLVSAEPNYNPSNAKITKTALEDHYPTAIAAAQDVPAKKAPNTLAITEREAVFDELPGLMRRSLNMLTASGASPAIIEDAKPLARKLTGRRKSAKIVDDPNTPEDESAGQRSASQMSHDNQRGNFNAYRALLANVPSYTPNEEDLKLSGLATFSAALEARSNAVSTTAVALGQARGVRDEVLYTGEDSVVERSKLVKAYVKGALGTDSALFKQIKGIEFRRPNKG